MSVMVRSKTNCLATIIAWWVECYRMDMDNETRIARLEERLTWLQQHAVEQDKVISLQSNEIKRLTKVVRAMQGRLGGESAPDGDGDGGAGEMAGERPPHY